MKTLFKKWWDKRLDRYYLKQRWHLVADAVLITIVLTLLLVFVPLYYFRPAAVDTNSVEHVEKIEAPLTGNSLIIESETNKKNISSEQEFTLKINISNIGKTDLTNIDLSLLLDSNKFSISRIKSLSSESSLIVSGRKILLANLSAGSSQEIILSLVIKSLPDSPRLVIWQVSGLYQEENLSKKLSYQLPDLKLLSSLSVKAAAYYNSPQGDQLGSGPIPPQVAIPTNYWVFFSLQNIGNKLGNLEVSAKLADNVSFQGSRTMSAGDFYYNEKTKKLSWKIKEVEVTKEDYQVGVELQLIPNIKQLGTSPALLTDLSFVAQDLYGQESIGSKLPVVDTNLSFDPINKGQGVVIK